MRAASLAVSVGANVKAVQRTLGPPESGTAQHRWNSNESGPFDRAETVGFEPTEGLLPHILSRDAH